MTTPGPNRQENSRKKKATQRLDLLLVQRGMSESREQARRLIMAGEVTVAGEVCDKPGKTLPADAEVAVRRPPRFVSRGGLKLEAALDEFGVDVAGLVAVDVGASTGGFTDCLLQRGVARVYAVDVGYGQLAWHLRTDPRVEVRDRTNVRSLTPDTVDPVDLVVADLSFISLATVLPALASVTRDDGDLVLMVKPQFEVGRERLGDGGVVRDPALRAEAVRRIAAAGLALGWGTAGVLASPLPGPAGNVEYFLWLRRDAADLAESDLRRAIEEGPS